MISSGEAWLEARQLRNWMVHEYVRDAAVLARALQRGHEMVPLLLNAAQATSTIVTSGHDA